MHRAIELAAIAKERVSPNPRVGCVIMHEDVIIGEGWHQNYGEAHAEVNAITNVKNLSLLPEATLYVNLEPCAHHGKTPPCAHLLLEKGIKRVVVANMDPNPLVAGKGVSYLRQNGVEVITGILSYEGEELNKRFFTAMRAKRPYIILKWAETADGFIAHENGSPLKISNKQVDIHVHNWRAEEDSILVGMNTVLRDNPRLNTRHWPLGKNPIRLIWAGKADIPLMSNILDQSAKTYIFNTERTGSDGNTHWIKTDTLKEILDFLNENQVRSVLVEGGTKTIEAFMKAGFYDEIRQIKNLTLALGKGVDAPKIPSGIVLAEQTKIKNNFIHVYRK
jgi:diaminohydroxyphosphoribosylaminopyrimidine deaminase / 5-amino-6-(5-phosphoribosylamino)uracil reductase